MSDRSPDSERFGPLERDALLVVREYMGEKLVPFLRRALETDAGDTWPGLEEERAELLEALDRLERRMAVEVERHTDDDGFVDTEAFLEAMLRWARAERD